MNLLLKNSKVNLLVLTFATFVLVYITNHYILTVSFFENGSDPLSAIPGEGLKIYESLQIWIYFATATCLFIKLIAISTIIYTALYINDHQVPFGKIFNIIVLAEFMFLIPAIIKLVSFPILYPAGTLTDWRQFFIFSALSLFKGAPADWNYCLETLNVFEVGYWFVLAFGISKITKLSFDKSIQIVVCYYLPALFIWVITVTFCTLLLFPGLG
jgi:hypothetical protein